MESLDTAAAAYMVEDLLDFSSDVGGDEEDDDNNNNNNNYYKSTTTATTILKDPSSSSIINPSSFPECAEEELEWLSNKDAFPTVDTFVDIITVNPCGGGGDLKHRSPVSVLDNNSSSSNNSGTTIMSCCFVVPVRRRARTNRWRKRRRGGFADLPSQQLLWFSNNQVNVKNNNHHMVAKASSDSCSIGRKCQHCQAEKTPQWRAGPMGPKTLCNACGVRYKSGRLVPEYRPASSPTFSSKLHSNSHRKVVEMRKQKLGNFTVNASVDKG